MNNTFFKHKFSIKKAGIRLVALLAPALLLSAPSIAHATNYTPYAVSVNSYSQFGVINPDNGIGAPDGQYVTLAGINTFIVLDKGLGSEGTQDLKVYLGTVNIQSEIKADFLDSQFNVITSASHSAVVNTNPMTQVFGYSFDTFHKAYRYVRLTSTAAAGLSVDAIEATGFIGSTNTIDTDKDGCPDRYEQTHGSDPAVAGDCSLTSSKTIVPSGPVQGSIPANVAPNAQASMLLNSLSNAAPAAKAAAAQPSLWSRLLSFLSHAGFCVHGWWFWLLLLLLLLALWLAILWGFAKGESAASTKAEDRTDWQKRLHKRSRMFRDEEAAK